MPLTDEELEDLEPRELLQLGIDLFNAGRYFDSHEAWEAAWIPSERPLRFFLQGLIQVAAAFVHLTRNEYPGTEKLLREALAKLERFRPDCLAIEVDTFMSASSGVLKRVVELGPKRLGEIAPESLPKVAQMSLPEAHIAVLGGYDQRWLEWQSTLDAPAVVLLHAPGLIPHVWQPVAARLAPAYRVLAPDLPGHGVSPSRGNLGADMRAMESWLSSQAPDVVAVVDAGAGVLASRLASSVGANAIAFRAAEERARGTAPDPRWTRDTWPGRWDLFRTLQACPPFDAWRPDLLWTYVEEGTAVKPMKASEQATRGMTEEPPVRLLVADPVMVDRFASLSYETVEHRLDVSPLANPDAAAADLMLMLSSLAGK